MDLLLDVNIVLDVCAHRSPYADLSAAALVHCTNSGGRLWLYTGSVQTLEYNLISELKHSAVANQPTNKQLMVQARAVLKAFTADKQWLAALAAEGDVFDSESTGPGRWEPGLMQVIYSKDSMPISLCSGQIF